MQDIRKFIDIVENFHSNSDQDKILIESTEIAEGPVLDKIKKTAAAGLVAGGLGYATLTGQHADKTVTPAYDQDQISQLIKSAEIEPAPAAPTVTKTSTASHVDAKMENLLYTVAVKAGLQGEELAQFMAQAAHETHGFTKLVERGTKEYFQKYDPKHNQRLAKILGNTKEGDGARYRGRGFLMITGRDIYKRAGQALGLPLESKPQLAADPQIAAKLAVWYWKSRVSNIVQDFTDTIGVTARINPNMMGLDDRDNNFRLYLTRLNLK